MFPGVIDLLTRNLVLWDVISWLRFKEKLVLICWEWFNKTPVPLWSSAMDFEWRVNSCCLYEENNSQMYNVFYHRKEDRLHSKCYILLIIDMQIIYRLTLRGNRGCNNGIDIITKVLRGF